MEDADEMEALRFMEPYRIRVRREESLPKKEGLPSHRCPCRVLHVHVRWWGHLGAQQCMEM